MLDPGALHGLAGEVVRAYGPHTEADPAGLLLTFLVMAGNVIGPGPHALVGAERHPARLNALLVGETSRGRKGTAQACMNPLFGQIEPTWFEERVMDGLSSGEGLIAAVRDEDNPEVELGMAPPDKRLMIVEGEFSRVLTVAGRDGSTLSQVLRSAYDSGRLRVLTRKDPLKASGAHVSIMGHITREELRERLTTTDAANGFGNRFLFARAEYRRQRAAEWAAWTRGLGWRLAACLGAAPAAWLLTGLLGLPTGSRAIAALLAIAGVSWRLRFRVSAEARAWRRGAAGERRTARLLRRLERDGYVSFHDLAVPGSTANTSRWWISDQD